LTGGRIVHKLRGAARKVKGRVFEGEDVDSLKMTGWSGRCARRVLVTLVFVGVSIALAGEPRHSLAVQEAGIGEFLTRNVFALTILFIFLVAIVGTFLKSRSKDKCLRDFQGYDVTIEAGDGMEAWGELRVYSNGIELEYRQPRRGADGNPETTFIFYDKQYNDLRRVCRYSDQLSQEDVARRERDVRRTANPSIFRRMNRWLRNVANTFRDALLEAIGAAVAQSKSAHPTSAVMGTQDSRVSKLSQSLISYAARAYDPVLEKHIFDSVLVEEAYGEQLVRHRGVLKEYSRSFIEILDVELRGAFKLPLRAGGRAGMNRDYQMKVEGETLRVSNRKREPIVVKEVIASDFKKEINRKVEGGESISLDIDGGLPEDAVIILEGKRRADILFPRARAWVRYGSTREQYAGTLR